MSKVCSFRIKWVPDGCTLLSIPVTLIMIFWFQELLNQCAIKHLKENLKPNGNPASLKFIFQNSWTQFNFPRKLTTHSMEILSEEGFYNWAVCFKYFRRGGETCKYLNSNKHFNIASWSYVSILISDQMNTLNGRLFWEILPVTMGFTML